MTIQRVINKYITSNETIIITAVLAAVILLCLCLRLLCRSLGFNFENSMNFQLFSIALLVAFMFLIITQAFIFGDDFVTVPKKCSYICDHGACSYEQCDSPACPGGACRFYRSVNPSCSGI